MFSWLIMLMKTHPQGFPFRDNHCLSFFLAMDIVLPSSARVQMAETWDSKGGLGLERAIVFVVAWGSLSCALVEFEVEEAFQLV